jgi:putative phosphoribosyl transferase
MSTQYQNRFEAGRFLGSKLMHHANKPDLIVLALPRGGVPVGYEVAQALNAPLDVFLVRKLGVPIYEELAMGAIASGGIRVLNPGVISRMGISERMVDAAAAEQQRELERRERQYRGDRAATEISGRTVILVDDGLATGATMRAAIRALRQLKPSWITVAVPIGAPDTCREMQQEANEVVCAKTPESFFSVGEWYEDFSQTTDGEVCELLNHAAHERRVRAIRRPKERHEFQPH